MDTRAGSNELLIPLITLGLPAEGTTLAAGDIEIMGNGPDGPLLTGIEYKKIPDLIGSIRSGRLAEQMRNMRDSYPMRWLLIEGRMREQGKHFQVQRECGKWFDQPGRVTYAEIASYTLTLAMRSGVLLWRTETQEETVQWVRTLYNWLTAKEWEGHRAHLEWYEPPPDGANPFTGPSLVQRVAATLPGVGSMKSARVDAKFDSVLSMVTAPTDAWMEIDGIGKKGAETITRAIRRGK